MDFNIEEYLDSLHLDTEKIDVSYKNLTYLPDLSRFTHLKELNCSYNKLTELPCLNNNLTKLNCSNNFLTKLPNLNDKLNLLRCINNRLKYLPNYNNLYYMCFDNNEIYLTICDIIKSKGKNKNFETRKQIVKILNKFRFTYYALKFKTQFKKWLWEKVREPKIMKQFHPDHLTALKETDDLEVFLEEWIKK